MTVSVSQDVAAEIRTEADHEGLSVSEWVERVAHREATRRAYTAAAAERTSRGLDSPERLDAYARRRAAVLAERHADDA